MADAANSATLDFIYEHVREAPRLQMQQAAAMDSKIVAVLGAAGIVAGLAALPFFEGASSGTGYWLAGALGMFLLTGLAALASLWTRGWQFAEQPDSVLETQRDKALDAAKKNVTEMVVACFANNENILGKKARFAKIAMVGLVAEAFLVGAAAVWNQFA